MKAYKRVICKFIMLMFAWQYIIVPCYPAGVVKEILSAPVHLVQHLLAPGAAHAGTPPDPAEYTANRTPGNFVDISTSGISLVLGDEDSIAGIPLGFNFEFYGTLFRVVTIAANGYLTFSPHSIPENLPIPSLSAPHGLIAPFWDDLNPALNADSALYYQTLGSAPNRQFVAQWQDVPLATDPGSRLTFQVVLFEGSGEIQFHYLSMLDSSDGLGLGRVSGSSATIGIESLDGRRGTEVAHNRESTVANGYAFSFTRGGTAFATGRLLGDLDGDGRVTILDQSVLSDHIGGPLLPKDSLELVLADVSPQPGTSGRAFGNGRLNDDDHSRLFDTLMGRQQLNPTLAVISYTLALVGDLLMLSGSGFSPVAGDNIVVFTDAEGNRTEVVAESVNASGTVLTAAVPAGTYFTFLWVENGGLASNAHVFALEEVPAITALSPDFGDDGDTVRIRGYEFGPTPADNQVSFDGRPATVVAVSAAGVLDELTVEVPADVTTGPVTVAVAGRTSNALTFTYDGPPLVAITTPAEGGEVTCPTEIVGTAWDKTLVAYTLEVAPLGGSFTPLSTGTRSVSDDVLGSIDPTLALNGFHTLRLTAADESGNVASVTRRVLFAGNLKAGINRITFTDLQVPVSGIPITVRRSYDSRVKTKQDFGVGWSVDILDVELQENQVPGEGWYAKNTGNLFSPNWVLRPVRVQLVMVRFPDGRTDVFEMTAAFDDPVTMTGGFATVSYTPRPGTTSTLAPITSVDLIFSAGDGQLQDLNGYTLYNPNHYLLTAKDGTKMVISQQTGLESIEDLNGNKLTINANGIVHSSGKSISFTRDTEGRIFRITDPMGNTMEYAYDENGDLVAFTDRESHTTKYTYDSGHNLVNIIDARDVRALTAEYDDDGRLVATTDANGNRIEMSHEIDNYQDIVTDRLGYTTVYQYDERGNITRKTDALGKSTIYTYDENNNPLTETDSLGNTTKHAYDEQGNLLTFTDPLGNVTSYTHNTRGQILTTSDPLGNTTTNTYDVEGNQLTTKGPLGKTWTYDYDAGGNRILETDPDGITKRYEYNSFGWLTRQINFCGAETRYDYDASGNLTLKIVTRSVSSGMEEMATEYKYDREGRLAGTNYADGFSTTIEYDELGNRQGFTDKLGRRITYTYGPTGMLTLITYPDGSFVSYGYDAEGRRITQIDQNANITRYVYDPLGRRVQTIYADGSSSKSAYDAVGRVITKTDENDNTTSYSYDAAGRRVSIVNALGNNTRNMYDAASRVISVQYPNGHIHSYEYDAKGHRIRSIYPDGSSDEQTYDFRGRIASRTDQNGRTTAYGYSDCGYLTQIIDPLGQITAFEYDEIGNRLSQTDANGRITTWEYDLFGRAIKKTLPLGMHQTMVYNPVGSLITKSDYNGHTTNYTYDIRNRRSSINYPDGTVVLYTYTLDGQIESVTDSRGITTFAYDQRGRLIERIDPNGSFISYAYDPRGNRIVVNSPFLSTTYSYDDLNRLQTVIDPNGGNTTYNYDNMGNRKRVAYPNGIITYYTYDVLNRLTQLENMRSGTGLISSYTYTLGPVGNRLRIQENTGRTVDYTYDELYRLVKEDIFDPLLGNETISYIYDPVGNRLSRSNSSGTAAYTYDANDRLLSENGITYTYDNNGSLLTRTDALGTITYTYDYESRLVSVQTQDMAIQYTYDVDGIRVGYTVNGVFTDYLVDKNRHYAQVLEEKDINGSLVASYVYGSDLIKTEKSFGPAYYLYDGQGSVRHLIDENDLLTDSYTYEGFGALSEHVGTSSNPYLFRGEQFDSQTGLYYLRARYYHPGIGRFLTADLASANQFEPQTLHRYIYALNNPGNRVDPSGQFSTVCCWNRHFWSASNNECFIFSEFGFTAAQPMVSAGWQAVF